MFKAIEQMPDFGIRVAASLTKGREGLACDASSSWFDKGLITRARNGGASGLDAESGAALLASADPEVSD